MIIWTNLAIGVALWLVFVTLAGKLDRHDINIFSFLFLIFCVVLVGCAFFH
jgi:hypothetical protein